MAESLVLHGYFRSSASWRVRIALNLKGLAYRQVSHHLRDGAQHDPAYRALNPQALVPALEVDGAVLTQSLAICEYLDERWPSPPLLPPDPLARARVRAFALAIACEVHPLQNLGMLDRLRARGFDGAAVKQWARETIDHGLAACATLVAAESGPFCFGAVPTLADVLLIPQLGNARRFGARVDWPRFPAIEAACAALPAFAAARPEVQPDSE
ncbi:MAG: maleylacetoacetate isomerase [Sphingomonadales bacterium]|nr:maleylacetoacetate isomerase [Sphingomonadales bacterium]